MLGLQPKKTPPTKQITPTGPGRKRKSELGFSYEDSILTRVEESSGFLVPRGTKLASVLTKKGIPAGRYSK